MEPPNNESIGTANFPLFGGVLYREVQRVGKWYIGHYERFFTIGGVHYQRFHCICTCDFCSSSPSSSSCDSMTLAEANSFSSRCWRATSASLLSSTQSPYSPAPNTCTTTSQHQNLDHEASVLGQALRALGSNKGMCTIHTMWGLVNEICYVGGLKHHREIM